MIGSVAAGTSASAPDAWQAAVAKGRTLTDEEALALARST